MPRRLAVRIALVAGLLAVALIGGSVGFHYIEDFPWDDAFYMTLITVSTVGYMEIHPLSPIGRLFNSFLILFGVSSMFVGVGAVTQTIIELELHDPFGRRRRKRAMMRLKDHYIVCGFGRVGRNAAFELQKAGATFVVIDNRDERVERAMLAGMTAVAADALTDETLREAGIANARGFIAALGSDAENVFAVLSARSLNSKLTIVTRASEEGAEDKLRRAGADIVFSPYAIAGSRLAQALVRPHVAQLLDLGPQAELKVSTEQLEVAAGSAFAGRTLQELTGAERRLLILAVRGADGKLVFNPPPSAKVTPGDFVIVMGERPALAEMETRIARG